jgi:PAS domain S-box-containing protein
MIGDFRHLDFGERLVATIRAGQTAVCRDAESDPSISERERAVLAAARIRAYVAVPLVKNGEWVATLAVHTVRPHSWHRSEIELVEEVAERTWSAVARARAETALRASESRLRLATEAARMFAWESDVATGAIVWSENAASVIGCRPDELPGYLIGGRALFFVHPADWPRVLRAYADAAARRRPTYAVGFRGRGAEPPRHYHVDARVLYGASGSPVRVMGVTQDVTERRRVEEERRRATAQLEETDRRRSEFLAVLSHELRNPLAPIRNSLYLLDHAPPGSERAARARDVLNRQAEHLTRLVDDLLDVTRISRGKVELQRARLDVRDVVRKATDDLRSTFEERGVALRVEQAVGPAWVDGDAIRLAQILSNLLHNAAKFTPAGGTVSVELSSGAGSAVLTVRDTGEGMEPGEVERMFEPFAQGAQGVARTRGGLGLGLALVKGFTEVHGGTVRASSAGRGRGAEFVVTLPLAGARPGSGAPAGPGPLSPGREILVIEDNADAARTLADVLELEGHHVRIAPDGRTGLALLRERPPDVVLCDVGLPDLSGYDVARAVRSDAALGATRLVALTGYAQPEDRERALASGFDAHLPKPPALDRLAALLRP